MNAREKFKLREAQSMGLGTNRAFNLPIKQRADVELFDGEPIYQLDGKDFHRRDLIKLSRQEIQAIAIPLLQVLDSPDDLAAKGFSEVAAGFVLPVVNRSWVEVSHNTITTVGFNWVADRLANDDSTGLNIATGGMRLGGSNTTPSIGDDDVLTDLGASGDFQAYSSGYPQDGGTSVVWRSFWGAGDATASGIQEVVIKEAISGNTAITRVASFGSINKGASDTLQMTITWNLAEG